MTERVIWFQVLAAKEVVRSQALGKANGRSVALVCSTPASEKPSVIKLELVAESSLNDKSRVNGSADVEIGGSSTPRSKNKVGLS